MEWQIAEVEHILSVIPANDATPAFYLEQSYEP